MILHFCKFFDAFELFNMNYEVAKITLKPLIRILNNCSIKSLRDLSHFLLTLIFN